MKLWGKVKQCCFSKKGKIFLGFLVVIASFAFLSYLFLFLPAKQLYNSALETRASAFLVVDAAKAQDLLLAEERLQGVKTSLEKTQKDLKYFSFARSFPYIGTYVSDAEHMVSAGFLGIEAAELSVTAIEPYADVLGLKGEGSFTGGTADERIAVALQTFEKVTPMLDQVGEKLAAAREEIASIEVENYPEELFGISVKPQMEMIVSQVIEADEMFQETKPVLKVIPDILGAKGQKTYLILLQNDKELRPSGGFLTAYAFVDVNDGKLQIRRSDDIYKLDEARYGFIPAPDPIRLYLPTGEGKVTNEWQLRDSNLSPDFKVSMQTFEEFYQKVAGRGSYDGIVAIDTHLLVRLLEVLGSVSVPSYGLNFTPEIDARCDCPQVIYVLEDHISRPVGFEKESRKELLGKLMAAMKEKMMSAPSEYWAPLVTSLFEMTKQKHILVYFKDEKLQEAAEAMNFAGRVKDVEGDYLLIVDANFAGAKANLYIEEKVTLEYLEKDGKLAKKVTISYSNPQAYDGFLNGEYRDWVRVYVPKGATLLETQGAEFATSEELGKTVFSSFLTVRPQGANEVSVTYTLPEKIGKKFPLLIQKQAGTPNHDYRIKWQNEIQERFELLQDVTYPISLPNSL